MVPNANRSLRWSTACPWICSGDMYAIVPKIRSVCRSAAASAIVAALSAGSTREIGIRVARPKSSTLT